MRSKLAEAIQASPLLRLSDLRAGDQVQGFEGWGCIPDNATRTVQDSPEGLWIKCRMGTHRLDGQRSDNDDTLLGMRKVPTP